VFVCVREGGRERERERVREIEVKKKIIVKDII